MKKQGKNGFFGLIKKEIHRQSTFLNLIPSENYASSEVLIALGSPLMNKYSEGYPGKRYYPGNVYYDEIEQNTQNLALEVFKLNPKNWGVNVQAYSGSPANLAAYLALMNPGDKLLGFSLSSGGHLTHGHSASAVGKLFNARQYEIDKKTGRIDYKKLEELARSFKPKVIVSGTTSYPRKIDFVKIGKIAKSIGAYHLADISHIAGLVLAGLHQSPFPFADVITMTTHKTLRGPRGALIFSSKKSRLPLAPHILNTTLPSLIDKSIFPGLQGGPHNNQTAAIGIALEKALKPNFIKYQLQIIKNSQKLAEELQKQGFTLYTGGTDNHLMLIDLKPINILGKDAEKILEQANITANRNSLPDDASPFNPTGLRLGTPAITTRGMKEKEMTQIADWLKRLLINKESPKSIKKEVESFLKKFPLKCK
ncbi:MAG: serine hydroxymethyltransferase [Patescibacteria group bacterium]